MKRTSKALVALTALAVTALVSHAATASDLIVGFGQVGAANDVLIDFGNVSNYTAPGTYNLGNYNSVLSANFTNWNTATGASAVQFGAVAANTTSAGIGKSNPTFLTSSWDTSVNGTLGVANSTGYSTLVNSQVSSTKVSIGNIDNAYGTLVNVGDAVASSSSQSTGWSGQVHTDLSGAALQVLSASQLLTGVTDLANNCTASYAAADLYSVAFGVPAAGNNQSLVGTLAVFQNGDVSFTVFQAIPEPSTYAMILGVATLGFAAIRRRKQAQLLA